MKNLRIDFILISLTLVLGPLQGLAVTGRTVNAKEDFGAVGTGTNDDTAALQRALDYLSTNQLAGAGVCLYLPAGTYKITNQLTFASTNPLAYGGGITLRGNGRDAPNASVIYSTSTNGALLFSVNDDRGLYNFRVQLQDLQIKAGVANAGAAVEIAKLTGTNVFTRTTPWLRNVEITRADTSCYFNYGFKAVGANRPVFDDVKITGNLPGMTCGISLTNHYGFDVSGCFISDADVAVDSIECGEGNTMTESTITNVNIGVRIRLGEDAAVSSSGGGTLNSLISARQIGVYIDHKNFTTFHHTIFSGCGGTGPYTNFYGNELRQATISECTFSGGPNQYGIVLQEDRVGTDNQNTISYNQFGSFGTSILVGTNVALTKIINNTNIQTNIVDQGINTYIVHGAPRPFYDSPAAHRTGENLQWSANAYAPIINVMSYGAKGDGVADDTTNIMAAVTAFTNALNSSGQGTLYFPAGRYNLSKQVVLTQSGTNWQRIAICGDGAQISSIEATSTNGIFKITCTSQVPVRISNFGLYASRSNSAAAIEIAESNGTNNGPRSLVLHDVQIAATGNDFYFKAGLIGQGLVRPLLQNNWINLYDFVDATGVKITGGYGFDWQGGKVTDTDTAGSIDSLGGAINIRGPGFCSGLIATGLTVNAHGGTFAHYNAHIHARNNLVVSNASEASFLLSETLWIVDFTNDPSSTLRFSNCTNIYVRDNCLFKSGTTRNRPLNTYVMLEGGKNSNVDISGNMMSFYDYEGTGINIAQGSSNVLVYDNRFFTFPAVDITNSEPTASIFLLPQEYRPELVGLWELEEGANSTVHGRNYLQQGAITGAVWTSGRYGSGLYFDGTNDSVTMIAPQFQPVMTNFTMMAWVKPAKGITGSNQGGSQSYVISGASPDTNANHTAVNLSVGTNGIRVVENGAANVSTVIDWVGTVSSSAWTHVAVTYSNNFPRLYINGVLTATNSADGTVPHPGGSTWGGSAWGWYKGSLDDVRVFDYPLSAVEITVQTNGMICDFNGSQATASAFSTADDWDGGVFPANDLTSNIARFYKTSYANQFTDSNYSLNGLIFGDGVTPTAPIDITIVGASGQQLMLGCNGIVMNTNAGAATVNKIQMGASQSWINNSTNILSVGTLGNCTTDTSYVVTLAGTGPINITGAISDNTNAGTTTVVISGATVTLGGDNTFTGGLTLNSGTIKYYGTGTPLGLGPLTIGNGVTFTHANTTATIITNQMTVSGNFTMGGNTNTQWGGTMDLNSGTRTITVSADSTVASIISNGKLIKAGTKTLTLSGANTYTGGTTVSNGALIASSGGALGTGNVTVVGGATLMLSATNCIGDLAVLTLATNSTLNLDFTGTDTVGCISLDGGANWLPSGTYDVSALHALGAGSLTVAGFAADPANTPFWWLAQYGLTNFEADAVADADRDGLLTWQEYIAGTNPTNAASNLRITGGSATSQGTVIRWSSASNKIYNLSQSTNLTEAFAAIAGATNLPATPPENVYTNPVPNGAATFYRISVHE